MYKLAKIICIIGPLLATYLSTLHIPFEVKLAIWIVTILIFFCALYIAIQEENKEKQRNSEAQHYHQLLERIELSSRGLPQSYIDSLGDNPELKHYFFSGQIYAQEYKYKEAIVEYKKCLNHPNATLKNKIAALNLITMCFYKLNKLKEAESYCKDSFIESKKIKDKSERVKSLSITYSNLALIYKHKGKVNKALKCIKKALRNDKKSGDKKAIGDTYGNMGILYSLEHRYRKGLKCHSMALEIAEKIGYERLKANTYGNMGIVYFLKGKFKVALDYQNKALEIDRNIGNEEGVGNTYGIMGVIYIMTNKFLKALEYSKKALIIFREIGDMEGVVKAIRNVSLIFAGLGMPPEETLEIYKQENFSRQEIGKILEKIDVIMQNKNKEWSDLFK